MSLTKRNNYLVFKYPDLLNESIRLKRLLEILLCDRLAAHDKQARVGRIIVLATVARICRAPTATTPVMVGVVVVVVMMVVVLVVVVIVVVLLLHLESVVIVVVYIVTVIRASPNCWLKKRIIFHVFLNICLVPER